MHSWHSYIRIAFSLIAHTLSKLKQCAQPPNKRHSHPLSRICRNTGYKHLQHHLRILPYAPSLPNSFVQSAFRFKSSPLTVGREALIALMKSFTLRGGSRSWSPSRSVQDLTSARASPGEHGVHFVSPSTSTYFNALELNQKRMGQRVERGRHTGL